MSATEPKKTAEKKKQCPLNPTLDCADCRWEKIGRSGVMCLVTYISHYLQGIAHE